METNIINSTRKYVYVQFKYYFNLIIIKSIALIFNNKYSEIFYKMSSATQSNSDMVQNILNQAENFEDFQLPNGQTPNMMQQNQIPQTQMAPGKIPQNQMAPGQMPPSQMQPNQIPHSEEDYGQNMGTPINNEEFDQDYYDDEYEDEGFENNKINNGGIVYDGKLSLFVILLIALSNLGILNDALLKYIPRSLYGIDSSISTLLLKALIAGILFFVVKKFVL